MFREFWARSVHFGQNGGWDESHRARIFFQQLRNGQFSPNFVTKRTSVSHRVIWKDFFPKIFTLGSFAPKIGNRKSVKQPLHSEQAAGRRDALQRDTIYSTL